MKDTPRARWLLHVPTMPRNDPIDLGGFLGARMT
jgi:hypothetical protein